MKSDIHVIFPFFFLAEAATSISGNSFLSGRHRVRTRFELVSLKSNTISFCGSQFTFHAKCCQTFYCTLDFYKFVHSPPSSTHLPVAGQVKWHLACGWCLFPSVDAERAAADSTVPWRVNRHQCDADNGTLLKPVELQNPFDVPWWDFQMSSRSLETLESFIHQPLHIW